MKLLSRNPLIRRMTTRRVFQQFASRVGLVYFGVVDQLDDDHRLIRGITLSPTSHDANYCIGTHKGYDLMCTSRTDRLTHQDRSTRRYRWTIVVIDLHTHHQFPHVLIGHNTRRTAIAAKFSKLVPTNTGMFGIHSPEFQHHFTIYTRPDHALDVERMLRPELTAMLAEHFADMSIELSGGSIYVYSELRPSVALLERMTASGTWLAELLDTPGLISPK